jgi:hypothetical protein
LIDLQDPSTTSSNQTAGTNQTTTSSLTFEQLLNMSYTQVNSSQVLLELALSAGYSSIEEMIPGLEMVWNDVSTVTCHH